MFVSYIEPHHQNDHHCYEGPKGSKERWSNYEIPGDLAGLPGDWQGLDLREAVGNTLERDAVFAQISESHTGRAIRTKKWKYAIALPGVDWTWVEQEHNGDIVYQEAFLYDLENDPHERNNLVADPTLADVRAELAEKLKAEIAKAGETVPTIKKRMI